MNKPVNHISSLSLFAFPSFSVATVKDRLGNTAFATSFKPENSISFPKEPTAFGNKVTFKVSVIFKCIHSTFILSSVHF